MNVKVKYLKDGKVAEHELMLKSSANEKTAINNFITGAIGDRLYDLIISCTVQ